MTLMSQYVVQVFVNLHPLNICMSYQQTLRTLDKISEDHDVQVQVWAEELTKRIEKPPERVSLQSANHCDVNNCGLVLSN